ncbi:hypothetical protein EMPS_02688 [Entomortierella parvispora]|uniref:Transglutaminase-like domain-containing protein n=1 Tax=Entomortierella parvispora TaxID=205924 RepID=A0A9P3H5D0_9FUNG|nr:hypothetical protein EMPS_02688 [Entomortierella parvispora]
MTPTLSSEDIAFYTTQTVVTDPGRHAALFEDLPNDVPSLMRTARNLIIHYRAENPLKLGVPKDRMKEIHTRHIETMLTTLVSLKEGSITSPRAPTERLVGCCRDFALMFVSMARFKGIPARTRVGFGKYFMTGLYLDHEVAEVWDADAQRWYLVDPELADNFKSPDGANISPLDVPSEQFLTAGEGWRLCQEGQLDPKTFMVGPDVDIESTKGYPQITYDLVQDFVALLKIEMLLWDEWFDLENNVELNVELINRLAEATRVPDVAKLRKLYEENTFLQVPDTVRSFDPLGGPPCKVSWKTRA